MITATMDPNPDPLQQLGVTILSQNSLERKVAQEADTTLLKKDIEIETKRLAKAESFLQKQQMKLRALESKYTSVQRISVREQLRQEIKSFTEGDLAQAKLDVEQIKERLQQAQKDQKAVINNGETQDDMQELVQLPSETHQEFLIRTGKITAFGTTTGFTQSSNGQSGAPSHSNLVQPGLQNITKPPAPVKVKTEPENEPILVDSGNETEDDSDFKYRYTKSDVKREASDQSDKDIDFDDGDEDGDYGEKDDDYSAEPSPAHQDEDEIDEDLIDVGMDGDDDLASTDDTKIQQSDVIDDGNESYYQHRLKEWSQTRSLLRKKHQPKYVDDPNLPEYLKPHPTEPDAVLNPEFKIPGDIFPSLFDYQKTCVQWLFELNQQKVGGIIGDEMGLGKTIQMISFLAGLHYSGKLNGPVLVVCPATVLKQWCSEFQKWWPAFRTVILHAIGEGMQKKPKSKRKFDDFSEDEEIDEHDDDLMDYDQVKTLNKTVENEYAKNLIQSICSKGGIILTTYTGVRIYSQYLLPVRWSYVVLDEGHKIRNPDSYITITCKQLRTPNRIILSGTPIQNNLVELWSLFDFVFPGKLGTLPVFQRQFCIPINLGGYANATNVQVQAGYKCAVMLKELISPYMLRRVKADVARDLPKKSEMVLFCKLTKQQRSLYEQFLGSGDLEKIIQGKKNALVGIDVLRKICNHPNLVDPSVIFQKNIGSSLGQTVENLCEKSGKLQVVTELLKLWTIDEERKVLLFTQTKQMLNILEELLIAMNKEQDHLFPYLRMDGSTPISRRQTMVDTFNTDPDYKVFLLTTRVGGLGVNLTGASRVIIYDPDWNPSTDMQARERAWRLGQKQDVVIYRLMIAGSIEEKIYHRQIFKQFLTNKILKDPKQKRFFKMTDLYDLFSLGDDDIQGTETADLFGADETNYEKQPAKQRKTKFKSRFMEQQGKPEILGLAKVENYQGQDSVTTMWDDDDSKSRKKVNGNDVNEPAGKDNDTSSGAPLNKILQSSNIHSSISHDSVLALSNPSNIDHSQRIVDQEAQRIADQAMSALRHSRKETRKTGVFVPTWTGKHGKAGKGSKTNAVITRNKKTGALTPARVDTIIPTNKSISQEELIDKVAAYLSSLENYFSTSGEILDKLDINVHDEQNVKQIRSMLKVICDWDKAKKGWVLKNEFR